MLKFLKMPEMHRCPLMGNQPNSASIREEFLLYNIIHLASLFKGWTPPFLFSLITPVGFVRRGAMWQWKKMQ